MVKFSGITMTLAALLVAVTPVFSAELIMMEQDGCSWCEQWHKDIGGIYHKTDEGKVAPLRIVNIHRKWPEEEKPES